jgi:hypothetical protein
MWDPAYTLIACSFRHGSVAAWQLLPARC